jgi:hypothetical protein
VVTVNGANDDAPPGEEAVDPDIEDSLLSRLRLIEDQPLESRADAYGQILETLQQRLDDGTEARRG